MTQRTLNSFDGTKLHYWAAMPVSGPPRAKILLVHGMGTHGNSLYFGFLREYLTGRGFAVYGFDLRGHGNSDGRRAYVNHWGEFRNDLRVVIEAAQQDTETLPFFLLGVSLGGLIAVNYGVHHSEGLQGLVTLAPALDVSGVPGWKRMLLRGLSKVLPKSYVPTGFHDSHLSRDKEAESKFNSDPLRQRKVTARLAREIAEGIEETVALLSRLSVPLLVLHGSADEIVPPSAGERLHQLAGSPDKQFHLYEGALHVLSMETNREEVFEDISKWVEERVR